MNPLRKLIEEIENNPDNADQLVTELRESYRFPIVDIHEVTFVYFGDENITQVDLLHWLYGVETQQA